MCGRRGRGACVLMWLDCAVDGCYRYHQTRTNSLVLYHFVGSPAHSTDYMNVLHRFMTEIKALCGIAEDVPSTLVNLQKKFPQVGIRA